VEPADESVTGSVFLFRARMFPQGCRSVLWLAFTRAETPKLLELARPAALALAARPSALHRCASGRRYRDGRLTGSRRPGGGRTAGHAHAPVGRGGHPGCHRTGSRRCRSPPQASVTRHSAALVLVAAPKQSVSSRTRASAPGPVRRRARSSTRADRSRTAAAALPRGRSSG
jgi:hypothetical protein